MKLLLTSLLLTLSISAADVSGKWTGTFIDTLEASNKSGMVLILTQHGSTLTGTTGPNSKEQRAIGNGKVDGNNISFVVRSEEVTVHVSLQLADNHLKGQANTEIRGQVHSGTIDLIRTE
jgi:hypothetical protein